MIEVVVSDMGRDEAEFAAGVVARGMRDNPNHIAAFGDDPLRRVRLAERSMGGFLRSMRVPPLCARRGAWIVGVCGLAPPNSCRLSMTQRLRLLPAFLAAGPGTISRTTRWMKAWDKRDPQERHWHLGPVAVEPGLQGMGIGSRMLERFAALMDEEGEIAYLETDKAVNVPFYERFGFRTVGEAEVLGQPNWFMVREPARA